MAKVYKKLSPCLTFIMIVFGLIMLATAFFGENSYLGADERLERVRLIGEYSVDGLTPAPLTEDTSFDAVDKHRVTLKGHFDKDIEKNVTLMMRIHNISVSLRVNGEEIFTYGKKGTYPSVAHSAGNVWQSFVSPGITSDDEIEIILNNFYSEVNHDTFELFVNELRIGSERALFYELLRKYAFTIECSMLIISLGVFVLASACIMHFRGTKGLGQLFSFGLLSTAGGIWMFTEFETLSFLVPYPVYGTMLDMFAQLMLPPFALLHSLSYIKHDKLQKIGRMVFCGTMVYNTFVFLMFIFGIMDPYELQRMHVLIALIDIGGGFGMLIYNAAITGDKQMRGALLAFMPTVAGGMLDIANNFIGFSTMFFFKYGFVVSMLIQLFGISDYMRMASVNQVKNTQLEKDLLESRVALMMNGIRPRFLYNALNSIRMVVRNDPERADEALLDLSDYLHANLSELGNENMISFKQVMNNVNCYLSIEKIRLAERLTVDYNIGYVDFKLPALSLETIVENALRNGIERKPGGGTIRVKTELKQNIVYITVSDDGAGFNQDDLKTGNDGINNVKLRLDYLCGGTLRLVSEPWVGTTVTIKLPVEKVKETAEEIELDSEEAPRPETEE